MIGHIDFPADLVIDGQAVTGHGDLLAVEDPATGETLTSVRQASLPQLDVALRAARDAQDGWWGSASAADRSRLLARLAELIDEHAEELARLIVAETGAPIAATRAFHVAGAANYFRWYSEAALVDRTRYLRPQAPSGSMVRLVPVGVVGAITAYNYPLLLAANKLGAALCAGCAVVLMPSPRAPLATMLLGRLLLDAGYGSAVSTVVGDADLARALTRHHLVDKVSFTGSTAVGEQINRQAAENGKGVVLELGGKAPCILMPDVDLARVTRPLLLRLFRNAGQGCQVPARLLVPAERMDEFVEHARTAAASIVVGDPWDDASEVGPVISDEHRQVVEGFITEALEDGGRIVAQSPVPAQAGGHWVTPTLIAGVPSSARINREEIFGPVGVVSSYADLDDAVKQANDSEYGLAAHVYGADTASCLRLAGRLRAGSVLVNGVGLRPDAPSGGFKRSGIGREQGEEGIREYLATQTISWAL